MGKKQHFTLPLKAALEQLRSFFQDHNRLPSLSEIAELCGYASRNSAVYLVNKLIAAQLLQRDEDGHLCPTPLFLPGIKLLGSIAAGFPRPEEEELLNNLYLEAFLVRKPTATYMLQVKGDSMLNAGILPEDYVLVERGRQARAGDVVVAMVDNQWTLKYYHYENGQVFLRAANPRYPDIHPEEELVIAGVVVSSCRKYV